jgi:hypothetical protein
MVKRFPSDFLLHTEKMREGFRWREKGEGFRLPEEESEGLRLEGRGREPAC